MAVSIKHAFTLAKPDGPDATVVQPSDWNAEHGIEIAAGTVVGRALGAALPQAVELPLAFDASLQAVRLPSGTTGQRPATPVEGSLRHNTTFSGYEVFLAGQWVTLVGNTAATITNLDTVSISGRYFAASGATGNPLSEPVMVDMIPADVSTRAVQMVVGLTTGERRTRIETAGVWGAWETMQRIVRGEPVTATGSFISLSSVPSWVNWIEIQTDNVSHNFASATLLVRAVVGGSAVTTGYRGVLTELSGATVGNSSATVGIGGVSSSATTNANGLIRLSRIGSSNTWTYNLDLGYSNGTAAAICRGAITLAGALDGVQVLPSGGSFDGGTITFSYGS